MIEQEFRRGQQRPGQRLERGAAIRLGGEEPAGLLDLTGARGAGQDAEEQFVDERREVAARVTLWVLEENETGAPPNPDEIARYALAEILFEAMTVEGAALLRDGKRPAWVTREGERQLRETANVLAQQANLSPQGASIAELERAIEDGLETLRAIWTDA